MKRAYVVLAAVLLPVAVGATEVIDDFESGTNPNHWGWTNGSGGNFIIEPDGGNPGAIGVGDLARPDYGDAVRIDDDEVPIFWACGVTPQWVAQKSRLPMCACMPAARPRRLPPPSAQTPLPSATTFGSARGAMRRTPGMVAD